jgi:flagellar biosynthesis anti-sigma factor FlgM
MENLDAAKWYKQQNGIKPHAENTRGSSSTPRNQPAFKNDGMAWVSGRARKMQIAWKAAKSAHDIRREKVEKIKLRLIEGRYQIDADQVAEKICDSLF